MTSLRVASWNLFGRGPERVGLHRLIDEWRPDLLLLQEADGDALEASPRVREAMPHRFLRPDAGYRPGMAILSRHTIDATGVVGAPSRVFDRPRLLWARVRLPGGPPLVAVSVHAAAPDSLLPPPYNPIRRNRQLAAVAAFAQRLIAEPARLLVGGDFNTVRYAIPGMIDAALAGGDRRATWRGLPLAWLPPILRLDRVFIGPGMRLVEAHVAVDHHGSDHCPVLVTVGTGEFPTGPRR